MMFCSDLYAFHLLLAISSSVVVAVTAEDGRSLGKVIDWFNKTFPEDSMSDSESADESLDEMILGYVRIWGPAVAFVAVVLCAFAIRGIRKWRWKMPELDPEDWPFDLVEKEELEENDVERNQKAPETQQHQVLTASTGTVAVCKKHKAELCTMGCHADYTLLNGLCSDLEIAATNNSKSLLKRRVKSLAAKWFQDLPNNTTTDDDNNNPCTGTNLTSGITPHESCKLLLKLKDPARIMTGFACNCYHYRSHLESRPSSSDSEGLDKRFLQLALRVVHGYEKVEAIWQKNQPAATATTESWVIVPSPPEEAAEEKQQADIGEVSKEEETQHKEEAEESEAATEDHA